jgi:hypothetical protein
MLSNLKWTPISQRAPGDDIITIYRLISAVAVHFARGSKHLRFTGKKGKIKPREVSAYLQFYNEMMNIITR